MGTERWNLKASIGLLALVSLIAIFVGFSWTVLTLPLPAGAKVLLFGLFGLATVWWITSK